MSSLSAMIKNPVDAWIGSHFIELFSIPTSISIFLLFISGNLFSTVIWHFYSRWTAGSPCPKALEAPTKTTPRPPIDNNRETNRSQATTQPLPPPITKTLSSPAHDQGRPNPHGHKISQKSS